MAATQNDSPAIFEPRLFDEDDDAEDLSYKQILNNVISLKTAPADAAKQLDEWVTKDAESRFQQLQGRNPPFSITEDENNRLALVAPNPSRLIGMIVESIAVVCSAFPPDHPAQTALIELLQQLKALPKHQVPGLSYDEDDKPVWDNKISLWPFGTASSKYVSQRFQREAEEFAYPFSDVETLGSEFQLRWRNLQSFVAHLTSSELIDCSELSALHYILPAAPTYPDLEARRMGGPKRIAADLDAASQWLLNDRLRAWVFRQCQANAGGTWSAAKWNQWKEQLAFISGDERFPSQSRSLAKTLRDKMDAQQ